MNGNTFGNFLKMVTFGESHGKGIGVVLEGVPSRLKFSMEKLQTELLRRAPGILPGTTKRVEADKAEIISGIRNRLTLGTSITVLVKNENQNSSEYENIKKNPRLGHGDLTYEMKYGVSDICGGGRASGRETVARVIAGYFASLIIPKVFVKAYAIQIGSYKLSSKIPKNLKEDFGPYFPDLNQQNEIQKYLLDLQKKGESVGGKVAVVIDNVPAGLGNPVFHKLKSDFAAALLSIGGVTSFSFGLGEEYATIYGTDLQKKRENFSGMEAGISNGDKIFLEIVVRTPSTIGKNAKEGRHDPCIVPRVIPVVEAMVKFVLADHYLIQKIYNTP